MFVLRSARGLHADIALSDGAALTLGRGPLTRIKDRKVSRRHISLTLDQKAGRVSVSVLGQLPALVAGRKLAVGEKAFLEDGDALELIEGQHRYSLLRISDSAAKKEKKADGATRNMSSHSPHSNHWSQGLLKAMDDPELKVFEDDTVVVIRDRFPKARHHFLVLPKEHIVDLSRVGREHVPLLEAMERAGETVAQNHEEAEFRLGYHAVASMSQLHLHVISQDLDSPALKTKKHWNSFTTAYFLPSSTVLQQLRREGAVAMMDPEEAKRLLNTDLKCHKCSFKPKNMPQLKTHLKAHVKCK